MILSAKHSFEIEIDLTATFVPASGDGYNEPREPSSVEDRDITSIGALRRVGSDMKWETIDILKGVDRKSDAYQQIVANILEFVGYDADDNLLESAE